MQHEPSLPSLQDDLALLVPAVRAAGAIAKGYFKGDYSIREKNPGDPVTEADLAVNESLKAALTAARPDYGWLSEEDGDTSARLVAPRVWIIDPIDGTKAFVDGRPEFVVSVGLVEHGRPVVAAIFNPITDQFFEAYKGGGAFLNGARVHVTRTVAMSRPKLGTSHNELRRQLWAHLFPEAELVAVDAIAYKLALLAAGEFDGVIALRPKSEWDVAAGDLLIHEAGGVMTDSNGLPVKYNAPRPKLPGLIASNPILFPAIKTNLAKR